MQRHQAEQLIESPGRIGIHRQVGVHHQVTDLSPREGAVLHLHGVEPACRQRPAAFETEWRAVLGQFGIGGQDDVRVQCGQRQLGLGEQGREVAPLRLAELGVARQHRREPGLQLTASECTLGVPARGVVGDCGAPHGPSGARRGDLRPRLRGLVARHQGASPFEKGVLRRAQLGWRGHGRVGCAQCCRRVKASPGELRI